MEQIKFSKNKDWSTILQRPVFNSSLLEKKVNKILNEVKKKGDKAVKKFTEEFDGLKLKNFSVTANEFEEAEKLLSKELKNAIAIAKNNIKKFHAIQLQPI